MLALLSTAAAVVGTVRDDRLSRYDLDARPAEQWRLPGRLREISALALTADERLLAVDDEQAIVYEIDYVAGGLNKAFALGEPTIREDFEGLASIGETVYLMTSDAVLFVAPEGNDGERVPFERVDTGLGAQCEFEGLAADAPARRLLLLCKQVRRRADVDGLQVFIWDIDAAKATDSLPLPVDDITRALDEDELHPSGITIDPDSGNLILVAARERALIELNSTGGFVAASRLRSGKRHPQAEGIELPPMDA